MNKVRYSFTRFLLGAVTPDTTLNHVYISMYYLSTLHHVYYSQEKWAFNALMLFSPLFLPHLFQDFKANNTLKIYPTEYISILKCYQPPFTVISTFQIIYELHERKILMVCPFNLHGSLSSTSPNLSSINLIYILHYNLIFPLFSLHFVIILHMQYYISFITTQWLDIYITCEVINLVLVTLYIIFPVQ